MGLSSEIAAIREHARDYLALLPPPQEKPEGVLRAARVRELVRGLNVAAPELTPRQLSNYSATQLRGIGLTEIAVTEVRRWLRQHGLYLKQYSGLTKAEMNALEHAVFLLDAYHIDVTAAKQQLADEQAAIST